MPETKQSQTKMDAKLKKALVVFFLTILGFIGSMAALAKMNDTVADTVDKVHARIEKEEQANANK